MKLSIFPKIECLSDAYNFVKNIHYYFLFFLIKLLPVQLCVLVYHFEILGVSKLAELKKDCMKFEGMHHYLWRVHGLYLKY